MAWLLLLFCPWQESLLEEMVMSPGPLLLVFVLRLVVIPPTLAQDAYRYIKFLTQHYDAKPKGPGRQILWTYDEGKKANLASKEVKTFIHDTKNNINAICVKNGSPYREGLRISNSRFQVTTCKHTGGSPWPPRLYRASAGFWDIVIACKNGFPNHFYESFISL